jgi:hypothetical protein
VVDDPEVVEGLACGASISEFKSRLPPLLGKRTMEIGTKLLVRDAIPETWYRSKHLPGRCVAGLLFNENKHRIFYIDGDRDLQSTTGLSLDMEIEVAQPKY